MDDPILSATPLGFPWPTPDPFLFCAYHNDAYPAGNAGMGPVASLDGRHLGNDFEGIGGWRMYHGEVVPGFPAHPHRGFETVTLARRGFVDHADSLGAAARFGPGRNGGPGDVQWITTGRGVVHSEMFPLLDREGGNPLDLFQIWLNLPKADKLVDPAFAMFWGGDVPVATIPDADGRITEVTVVAGRLGDLVPPPPPPRSWAARPDSGVAIWTLRLAPSARYVLPASPQGVNRVLYLFRGRGLRAGGDAYTSGTALAVRDGAEVVLENGPGESELLMLQGRPIAEPVVQYGPFVMNTRQEIEQAFQDYQRTLFGSWPWNSDAPVHPRAETRFARYPDGRVDRPR
ncbi:MAG TPA: pirin-like C-terminal cupin domain-containing protein [Fibrobacteria bacterium]|nr:pirin-like C-terminal cupin domain-containing protein [Fibrobacteria bacterium]